MGAVSMADMAGWEHYDYQPTGKQISEHVCRTEKCRGFYRSHLHEAVYMNAKELAEKTSFSESGVVRFCGVFRL
jgi:hypothetical protein